MVNVAINGFGRIGRNFLRAVLQDKSCHEKIKIVVINIGQASIETVAHMFKYDTLMGIYPGDVSVKNGQLIVKGLVPCNCQTPIGQVKPAEGFAEKKDQQQDYVINLISELDVKKIDWKKYSVHWVVDATGKFTKREDAQLHINSGAEKVLITAPAENEDVTIIPGVNNSAYDAKKHNIVSLGSCTTNAILPIVKVLHENFGIEKGFMTTVHAYTNDQVLLDVEKKDLRRARAAALNIVPTTTGAQKVIGKVMPELNGLIGGASIRVPVGKVSLVDFAFEAKKEISIEKINKAFEYAASGELNAILDGDTKTVDQKIGATKSNSLSGILAITNEPLVSSDYAGNNNSVIVDGLLTDVKQNMAKVFGWYDNEWGYSVRLKDFLLMVS